MTHKMLIAAPLAALLLVGCGTKQATQPPSESASSLTGVAAKVLVGDHEGMSFELSEGGAAYGLYGPMPGYSMSPETCASSGLPNYFAGSYASNEAGEISIGLTDGTALAKLREFATRCATFEATRGDQASAKHVVLADFAVDGLDEAVISTMRSEAVDAASLASAPPDTFALTGKVGDVVVTVEVFAVTGQESPALELAKKTLTAQTAALKG